MSVELRADFLRALAETMLPEPPTANMVAVYCNGCGRMVEGETIADVIKEAEGWMLGTQLGDDDYCPGCAP